MRILKTRYETLQERENALVFSMRINRGMQEAYKKRIDEIERQKKALSVEQAGEKA